MLDIICCNHETHKVINTERLLHARNEGLDEYEAQEAALMGYYCEICKGWSKETEGHLLSYNHLDKEQDYYHTNKVGCLVFEGNDE